MKREDMQKRVMKISADLQLSKWNITDFIKADNVAKWYILLEQTLDNLKRVGELKSGDKIEID